jgi:hypothetical protein
MTTILSRKTPGSILPWSTSEKETEPIVPGAPRKSIQADEPPNCEGLIVRPEAISAATSGNDSERGNG